MNLPDPWLWCLPGLWSQAEVAESVGRGIDWHIEPLGPVAPWVLGLVAVGLVAIVAVLGMGRRDTDRPALLCTRRRVALVAIRSAVLCLLVWMIGGWSITRFETELPDLVVMIDSSQSMILPKSDSVSGASVSRWESAVDLLSRREGDLLRQLAEHYRLRVQTVGPTLQGVDGGEVDKIVAELRGQTPDAATSPLGVALAAAVRGQRGRSTAALVMITDGVVTEGIPMAEAARTAASARLPVILVATGSRKPPPQVAIAEIVSDTVAMVGDRISVVARIRWAGTAGEPLQLRLIDEADQTELASQRLATSSTAGSETVELSFLASEAGVRRLRLEVDRLAGEVAPEDNVKETVVEIRDESFRVLLITGNPSYEFRFLKHLLERATNRDGSRPLVDLVSVLQSGDARYADQDRTARRLPPVDDESLEELDLIILNDCDPAGLGTMLQTRIVEMVTRGGASLVVIAGPDHLPQSLAGTPLQRLLPVEPAEVTPPTDAAQPLRWNITPLGRAMPNLRIETRRDDWSAAPPIYWLADAGSLRPGARVLIETPDRRSEGRPAPIVVSQLAGLGQVWLQLTDESFRLRGADPEAALYERYWLQLVRSLAKRSDASGGDQTVLAIRGERFPEGRPVPFRVQLTSSLLPTAGGEVEIAVTDREGQTITVRGSEEPAAGGSFRGLIEGLTAGVYRAVLTHPVGGDQPASDAFVVEADSPEMRQTAVDITALRDVAAISGGSVLGIDQAAEQLVASIPAGRAMRTRPLPPIPIWNHPLVALLLFAGLTGEWCLRRRWGSV